MIIPSRMDRGCRRTPGRQEGAGAGESGGRVGDLRVRSLRKPTHVAARTVTLMRAWTMVPHRGPKMASLAMVGSSF